MNQEASKQPEADAAHGELAASNQATKEESLKADAEQLAWEKQVQLIQASLEDELCH
jgi:hypothetical protein